MLTGPLVFVDVDTQRDFLEPDGALFVLGSQGIRPNLARLTQFARTHHIPVLATACAHTLDQPDPEPFPPHCLVGTPGQQRIAETEWPGTMVVPHNEPYSGPCPVHLTIEKQCYDVFRHPCIDQILARYTASYPTFVVYGVATGYCVKATVLGLLARSQQVAIVADAIRAVDQAREADELTNLVERGASLVLTDVVCDVKAPLA
jgi:nicotinamidase/pyrazinamidase